MTHFNYYKEKLDNFEETINQMHSPLEADDLTKIKCIKRKLLYFKTKIVNSNFCANDLLASIDNMLLTIKSLLADQYLYRLFVIRNTKNKIGKVTLILVSRNNKESIQAIDNIIKERVISNEHIIVEPETNCDIIIKGWTRDVQIAKLQKKLEFDSLKNLKYHPTTDEPPVEWLSTNFMRELLPFADDYYISF